MVRDVFFRDMNLVGPYFSLTHTRLLLPGWQRGFGIWGRSATCCPFLGTLY